MSKLAILSDIHANLEALQAVIADIDALGVKRIVCLGDIIGYGPDPIACLDIARERFDFSLLGDHEYGIIRGVTDQYDDAARASIEWTAAGLNDFSRRKQMKYVMACAQQKEEKPFLFVHGSTRDPIFESIYRSELASECIEALPEGTNACFVGHSHLPAVFKETEIPEFLDDAHEHTLDVNFREIINVGSVGQPRDKNPTACYVVVEGEVVRHRRVDYDFQTTGNKIRAIPELDNYLAERLVHGS